MGLFPTERETIEGVGRALRDGATTCVEVLNRCLDRIEEWEPRVRAWVVVDRAGAIESARALDEELSEGKDRGPLHGIPIGIKDIIDVKGLPTACGFRPWAGRVAAEDASLVAALRRAGAVILGKTVTTQFAWIDPPVTRNPWDLERTPGGSSSGSAAAVALGMCLGAIGTQTGGSITRPASFCGVAGFKPSFGTIDEEGIFPFARSLDHPGPMARSVGGLEAFAQVLVRFGWEGAGPVATQPPTLNRLRGFFETRAEPVMLRAFERALDALADAGARIEEADWPEGFDDVHRRHRVIMASQAAAGHERRLADHFEEYQPKIRALVEEGLATPAVEYIRCLDHHHRLWVAMTIGEPWADPFIVPATIGPAPDASTTGDPVFNSPWSYAGLPVISIPFALTPDGLPLALQIVGKKLRTKELFPVARWCEAVLRDDFRRTSSA